MKKILIATMAIVSLAAIQAMAAITYKHDTIINSVAVTTGTGGTSASAAAGITIISTQTKPTTSITVVSTSGLTGAIISIGNQSYIQGTDWAVGINVASTAINIKVAISAYPGISVSTGGTGAAVVFATATVFGSSLNGIQITAIPTSKFTVSSSTFFGGQPQQNLFVNINGDGYGTVLLSTADTTGARIASDMQTQIEAFVATHTVNQAAITATSVTFIAATTSYLVTSGSTGTSSSVWIDSGGLQGVLKFGPAFGGTESYGTNASYNSLIDMQRADAAAFQITASGAFGQWKMQSSNDGVNFIDLNVAGSSYTFGTSGVASMSPEIISFSPMYGYRYLNFNVTTSSATTTLKVIESLKSDTLQGN